MVHLGNLCAQSKPPDLAATQAWWTKAADAGDSNAMYNLAILFASSDPRTAIAWIEKAAAAGHSEALAFLNERER
jgi:TPR repeat protein